MNGGATSNVERTDGLSAARTLGCILVVLQHCASFYFHSRGATWNFVNAIESLTRVAVPIFFHGDRVAVSGEIRSDALFLRKASYPNCFATDLLVCGVYDLGQFERARLRKLGCGYFRRTRDVSPMVPVLNHRIVTGNAAYIDLV